MFDVGRRPAQFLAVFAIGWVVLELQGEQLEREFLKLPGGFGFFAPNDRLERLSCRLTYETSNAMCKSFYIVLGTHAVFILPGWFSATARGFYVHANQRGRKILPFCRFTFRALTGTTARTDEQACLSAPDPAPALRLRARGPKERFPSRSITSECGAMAGETI